MKLKNQKIMGWILAAGAMVGAVWIFRTQRATNAIKKAEADPNRITIAPAAPAQTEYVWVPQKDSFGQVIDPDTGVAALPGSPWLQKAIDMGYL